MSSSGTNSNGHHSTNTSNIVAIVSLIISIIAFVAAAAQVVQQYAASAEGYKKCQNSVVGRWYEGTRRSFKWTEFRFETLFETPVIFLARPENQRGPVQGRDIYNADGTNKSYEGTRTLKPEQSRKEQDAALQQVHTADDERATWVNLLEIIQKAEYESREWDKKQRKPPKEGASRAPDPKYTIVTQIQRRRRNWDFQPAAVPRPYATTTISHITELAALLGMIWKTYDPDNGNIRAEGNGLAITSAFIPSLGLLASFVITGRSKFTENRAIPCYQLKDILFGTVPTIIEDPSPKPGDAKEIQYMALQFGNRRDTEQTLKWLRCKPSTVEQYFSRHTHIRSIDFDLIAMIGQVFRIRGSNFKMLPNPTTDHWNKMLSASTLMHEYQRNLDALQPRLQPPSKQLPEIQKAWSNLKAYWKYTETEIDLELREKVHDAIDACDIFLKDTGGATIAFVVRQHITAVVDELVDKDSVMANQDCDERQLMDEYFTNIRGRIFGGTTEHSFHLPSPTDRRGSTVPRAGVDSEAGPDVWLTLMFRMCCWWMLHDFDPNDSMILLPRFKDSRLPAFIA